MRQAFDVGEAETPFGRSLLQVRYRALQRQIPLLYLIVLANVVGFNTAAGFSLAQLLHPINLLVLLVVARLAYWVRRRNRELPPERILRELRVTLLLAVMFSLGAGYWGVSVLLQGDPAQRDLVVLFSSLASVGCAYGLSSFPTAARVPLLLIALPLSVALIVSDRPGHAGVGVSLMLIVLLTLRLFNRQNRGFVELVRSRSEIDLQRQRAQRAKRAALREKARVKLTAETDPLTGLANRRAFITALSARLREGAGEPFALALLDLDGFKPINDTFGHLAGDAVLIQVAQRLRDAGGPNALVARIGGDEFALVLRSEGEGAALQRCSRISEAVGRPYRIEGREFRLSACCGVVMLRPGECDVAAALRRGDAALYSGKKEGRGCVALFTPELERANRRRVAIERALRAPEVKEQVAVVFQPIFDLAHGGLRGFEALARWEHPELGRISPAEFIPITEQINAIEGISDTLLARAAAEAAKWPKPVHLSFNLSAVQLCSGSSAARILDIVAGAGLAADRLQIEVTETALLADFETARLNLDALRAAGASIVLDDFGAGFASIAYLREINFDVIKLDGTLVTGASRSPAALRLLKGVLDLCASLGVPCVAEHIETPDQLELLRRMGCRDGQGYALSPPIEAAAARAMTAARVVPLAPVGNRTRSSRAA